MYEERDKKGEFLIKKRGRHGDGIKRMSPQKAESNHTRKRGPIQQANLKKKENAVGKKKPERGKLKVLPGRGGASAKEGDT